MATAIVEDEIDYLIEGVQLHPRCVGELREAFVGQVRVCFLGCADADSTTMFHQIRRYGGGADDWLQKYSDQQLIDEVDRLKALSQRIRDACHRYGFQYFEVNTDLSTTTASVILHFAESNERDGG